VGKIDSGTLESVIGDYQDPLAILEDGERFKTVICGAYNSPLRLRYGIRRDIEGKFCAIPKCNRY